LKSKIDIPEDLKVDANRDYLYIFLSNIIWNAIKYNKNKWSVDISYKSWELIIKDSWIWMSKDELKHIFDRFYKTDKSRNSEGFWIWLSLVKKIALIYKWKIDAFSVEGEGSEFKVKF
jgi:signal transduction histidine kinase